MTDDIDIAIFGIGGHGREMALLARRVHGADVKLGFVVDQGTPPADLDGTPVLSLDAYIANHLGAPIVAAIGNPAARRRVVEKLRASGATLTGLIHPGVELPPDIQFGEGVVIASGVHLTTNVALGAHVHVNLGCTISHDVVLEDFCTLSPGVNIAGYVRIGSEAFIGIGATVINGTPDMHIEIGAGVVVGAGACVVGSVPPGVRIAGVPARQI